MSLEINWSEPALLSLAEVLEYTIIEHGERQALKLRKQVMGAVRRLSVTPFIAAVEPYSERVRRTIHVATAGTLPDLIQNFEKNLIEELTLTGELNGTDLAFLREMAGRSRQILSHLTDFVISDLIDDEAWSLETQGKLIDLDIYNANIVSGGSPYLQFYDDYKYSSDNTIPAGLFFDSSLSSIKLPRSISNIESCALGHCPLTSITIPNSVTSISGYAFYGCSGLTSVIIGKGVQSIGNAFYNCNNLQEMILSQTAYENGIPASVTKLTTYSKNPMRVVVTSKTATSAAMKIYPIDDSGNTNEDNFYTVTMQGLEPGQYIKWKLDDENNGIISEKTNELTDEVDGDVNGDGVVNDADVKDVASHIMGMTPKGFNKDAADVNNDNRVNAADIVLINKIINKK